MTKSVIRWIGLAVSLGVLGPGLVGCSSSPSAASTTPPVYVLSVTSIAAAHAMITTVSPADISGTSSGQTALSLSYKPGTTVTVTAAASNTNGAFQGWCDASSADITPFKCVAPPCMSVSGLACTVVMNGNLNLLATYPGVTEITVTPLTGTDIFPANIQFNVTVNGIGNCTDPTTQVVSSCQNSPYSFSLSATAPTNFTSSPGTISSTGLYTPSFPAPTTVAVKVSSTVNPLVAVSVPLTISVPAVGTGPSLTVDVGSPTHAISPLIYGINDYSLDPSIPAAIDLPIERWGGDATTRYNYQVDATNSASDYFFENNFPSTQGYPQISQFNSQVAQDRLTNTKTIVTVPVIGYVTQRQTACGYSVAKYGAQTMVDPSGTCGTGILQTAVNGSTTIKNDPTDTSVAVDQTFAGNWANFLVGKFGTAANGGVAVYALDNEPEYWNGVHKDVHPNPFTYDELSNKGIAYAAAIKAQDPTAAVSGPVISNWIGYFYSATDISNGYSTSPYCQQANPSDRMAHGDVPLIEYYLQQFQKYQAANNTRLLDYVDLHTYFAAQGAAFNPAGSFALQEARLNSTRVFWDATYTDPNYTDPTDTATTRACKGAPYPPNLINLMKGWVARDYPGTKLAITEYNWGGQESINGALAQADILGIFGREGLDLATLWGPPPPMNQNGALVQQPGIVAFTAFTNYDGKGAHFGDMAVTSTSADQGTLAVYGATRTSDSKLTVVIINKGYIGLNASLSLPNLKPNGNAQVYLYSAQSLTALLPQPSVPVTAASGTGSASVSTLFPAQSITVLIIPRQ